ncbi:hypothetical protein VitviT2T_023979 [Vitis vinifera]|uniref:Disease resistance N-terminal domain-containing protein n=1 Tax=Vitis vinifera TaxID=29760 RepID=A0ABY9DG76_VITVI|nr:hypothetical protein VitviT2T_023979 [Vitis vinifera]
MRLCLKDADAKSAYDERLKLWVNQIKDVTYDAEDIIDEFIIKVDHQQRQRLNYLKFLRFLPSCISLADRLPLVQELEAHIREIDIKIEKISANKSRYAIENLRTSDASSFSYEVMQRKEKRLPTVEEVDVVGVEDCNGVDGGGRSNAMAEEVGNRVLSSNEEASPWAIATEKSVGTEVG